MNLDDTIVAIATPLGRGGIGVVRLAGPEARAVAEPMLRKPRALEPGRAIHCDLIEPGSLASSRQHTATTPTRIDEVVVTYFAKPHSYTTDDIIEISAHGSPVVLGHIVELALARGARIAEPGEFTQRAFLNGRLDLTQAEAVRDLIEAQTEMQLRQAARNRDGALRREIEEIREVVLGQLAAVEASVDFSEEIGDFD